jgi:hypothetical protein
VRNATSPISKLTFPFAKTSVVFLYNSISMGFVLSCDSSTYIIGLGKWLDLVIGLMTIVSNKGRVPIRTRG